MLLRSRWRMTTLFFLPLELSLGHFGGMARPDSLVCPVLKNSLCVAEIMLSGKDRFLKSIKDQRFSVSSIQAFSFSATRGDNITDILFVKIKYVGGLAVSRCTF